LVPSRPASGHTEGHMQMTDVLAQLGGRHSMARELGVTEDILRLGGNLIC